MIFSKFFKDIAVISAISFIFFIFFLEAVPFFIKPLVMLENRMNRRIMPDFFTENLSFKNAMLIDKFRRNELRGEKLVNYGSDPMFYIREPGFIVKDRYESMDYIYRIADETGYLNQNAGYYSQHETIDIFFTGDSVIQGAGMPSVVEFLKKRSKSSIWIQAIGSYSPRQKVQSLIDFSIKKNPQLMIIDFSSSDASESIEDYICEKYSLGFRGRFHFKTLRNLLLKIAPYKDFLRPERTSWLYDHSVSYRACYQIKNNIQLLLRKRALAAAEKNIPAVDSKENSNPLSSITMSKPAYAHFNLKEERRISWVKEGMALTLVEYKRLLSKIDHRGIKVMVLYNPSAYEVYRDVLPKDLVDETADKIYLYQKAILMNFCKENSVIYFDLTEGLRQYASKDCYIYGKNEGTHWSKTGTLYVADIIAEFLSKNALWEPLN